jgi:dihydrofolate reductase
MSELLVDFITSLDGYASGEGWPGWWGLEGPEYLAWLGEQPEATYLMGANTYRLMSGFAAGEVPDGQDEFRAEEEASVDELTQASKVVFSSSLEEPLTWANSTLVRDDAVEAVRAMKSSGSGLLSTIGSLSLCRSLLRAGLVDRFRVVMFPVITGATGAERIYDGYPDVALEMIEHRTFDGRIQLVEYKPACSSTRRPAPLRDVAPSAGLDGRQAGERPSVGGGRINATRDQITGSMRGGRVEDFVIDGSYPGSDPKDQHVHVL